MSNVFNETESEGSLELSSGFIKLSTMLFGLSVASGTESPEGPGERSARGQSRCH
jgi:hypothetical protein